MAARLWNELSLDKKSLPSIDAFKRSHNSKLPKPQPLYYLGGRLEASIHARMRIRNSPLKEHLCENLHVIANPNCPCGTGQVESSKHFFFECTLFEDQRRDLRSNLLPYVINNYRYLLFGVPDATYLENCKVFSAVHKFIRDSNRFY